jgi:hypothetical protein
VRTVPPTDDDGTLELDHDGQNDEGEDMAEQIAEQGNIVTAMTMMANEAAAGSGRRTAAADQLASDSQRMWSIAMTSPTVMAAHGMRVANESGAGRTRVEANTPPGTQVVGGQ